MSQVTKLEKQNTLQAATPAALLEIAINQNADLDRLEKLMEMQQRWEDNEARKAYVTAMAGFQAEGITIIKDKEGHNSKYASLSHTLESIGKALQAHGLTHSWKTDQRDGLITVTCCVTHQLGHKECTSMFASPDSSGSKNNIQAIGSTVSYLQRYTLYAVLGLASKEDDTDGGKSNFITNEQVKKVKKLAKDVGANEKIFLEYLKVETFEDIPASKYNMAINALEAKRKQK